jgi:hypothetical protein
MILPHMCKDTPIDGTLQTKNIKMPKKLRPSRPPLKRKSSSRVSNIPAESNTISKSRLGTQNPTTPCRKIATFPSETQQNHKNFSRKNQQKNQKKSIF